MRGMIALCCAVLCACTGMQRYEPPKSGPMADVSFMNKGDGKLVLSFFRDYKTCKERSFFPWVTEPILGGQMKSTRIAAGGKLAFGVSHYKRIGPERILRCLAILTFDPKADHKYLFIIKTEKEVCLYKMLETSPSGENRKVEFIERKYNISVSSEKDSFCPPL